MSRPMPMNQHRKRAFEIEEGIERLEEELATARELLRHHEARAQQIEDAEEAQAEDGPKKGEE